MEEKEKNRQRKRQARNRRKQGETRDQDKEMERKSINRWQPTGSTLSISRTPQYSSDVGGMNTCSTDSDSGRGQATSDRNKRN